MTKVTTPTQGRGIQSIAIGCRILRAFERTQGRAPLKDIAAAAGMPASKVRFYMVSFLREGLVVQDPTSGHYSLGPYAIQLGMAALRQTELVEFAREPMLTLRNKTKISVFLTIWANRGPTIISKIEGEEHSPMTIRVGYVLPLLVSATGLIYAAHLPAQDTEPVFNLEKAMGLNVGLDPAVLETQFETVRKDGFALSDNKLNQGFSGASAPIFDAFDDLVGALTLIGSNTAFQKSNLNKIIPSLVTATREVSHQLGRIEPKAGAAKPDAAEGDAPQPVARRKSPRAKTPAQ